MLNSSNCFIPLWSADSRFNDSTVLTLRKIASPLYCFFNFLHVNLQHVKILVTVN